MGCRTSRQTDTQDEDSPKGGAGSSAEYGGSTETDGLDQHMLEELLRQAMQGGAMPQGPFEDTQWEEPSNPDFDNATSEGNGATHSEKPDRPSSVVVTMLFPGDLVKVRGLITRPELNGFTGVVMPESEWTSDRVAVCFDDECPSDHALLKPKNLATIKKPPPSGGENSSPDEGTPSSTSAEDTGHTEPDMDVPAPSDSQTTASPTPSTTVTSFEPGDRVEVYGLVNRAELNGAQGIVATKDEWTEARVAVNFDNNNTSKALLKVSNLKLISPTPEPINVDKIQTTEPVNVDKMQTTQKTNPTTSTTPPSSVPLSTISPDLIQPGAQVKVIGLMKRAELNGVLGVIASKEEWTTERVAVNFLTGSTPKALLKRQNLVAMGSSVVRSTASKSKISQRGVSVQGVKALLALLTDKEDVSEWSVKDMVVNVIKPCTAQLEGNRSFLASLPSDQVGQANLFVSHAWAAKAEETIHAVIADGEDRMNKGEPEPFYYFDVVCNDQHMIDQASGDSAMGWEWWTESFTNMICGCGRMLVVASPFDAPIVTQRAWCLFEAAVAMANSIPVTVITPPSQKASLREKILQNSSVLVAMMKSIDSRTAKATVQEDLNNIRKMIETEVSGGYTAVNALYKSVLSEWILDVGTALFATFEPTSDDAAQFSYNLGLIFHGVSNYPQSVGFLNKALEIQCARSQKHKRLPKILSTLGLTYNKMSNYTQAIGMYDRALSAANDVYAPTDPMLGDIYHELGYLYDNIGQFEKAMEFYEKALEIRNTNLDANTAVTLNNMGLVFKSTGRYQEAISSFEAALKIYSKMGDSATVVTASAYNNLGLCYRRLGDFDQAIGLYEQALAIRLEVLGPRHEEVGHTYGNLAVAYESKGNIQRAREFYKKDLEIVLQVHGPHHPSVATTYNNMAGSYMLEGDFVTARDLYQKSLDICLPALGSDHPDVKETTMNLTAATMMCSKQ